MLKAALFQRARDEFFRQVASRRENSFLRRLRGSRSCDGSRYVAYFGSAGLANRLRAHVIASAYAERTGRTLVPIWASNQHLGCVFADLFEFDASTAISFQSIRHLSYLKNINAVQGDASDYAEDLVFFKTQWQDVSSEYLLGSVRPYCDSFRKWYRPRAEITAFVECAVTLWPQCVLGVHIRRGDFVTHTGQAIPQLRYIAAIRQSLAEMPERAAVFLASDASPEQLEEIYAAFPGRILPRVEKPEFFEGARGSLPGARGSLIDILLLSRASRLILTPGSTFGEFAAQISNAPVQYA